MWDVWFQGQIVYSNIEHLSNIDEISNQLFLFSFLGMTMEDIRALEDKTKEELEKQRSSGEVRGTKPI